MSYSGRFVTARPPSKRQTPARTQPTVPSVSNSSKLAAMPTLTPAAALAAFHKLLAGWSIAPAPAWRMLTGLGYQAGSLTDAQAVRVAHLIAIDAAMKKIGGQPVGIWMTTGNMAPVFSGSSPMAYLTRGGQTAYATLLRQVERWATM